MNKGLGNSIMKAKLGFILLLLSARSFCSPASIEYVARELEKLRNDVQVQINSLVTSVNQVLVNVKQLPIVTHQVGEVFQGGMVFYVDGTKQHGLLVSLAELGEPIEWRNGEGGERITNAKAQGLGSGETNTRLIIAEQTVDAQDGDFAALRSSTYQILADGKKACPQKFNASIICYGGWYLPSAYELGLLHNNLKLNGLAHLLSEPYWSSSEYDTTQALAVDFSTGELRVQDKAIPAQVRAIRNF